MNSNTTTLITVCHPKHINVWKIVSLQILNYIKADNYILIVPDKSISEFRSISPDLFQIKDESLYLEKINIIDLEIQVAKERIGWYLQQFIKLEAIHRIKPNENIIIWDSDTVPLKGINFFKNTAEPIFYYGYEYHLPYFKTIKKLMGFDKIITYSFIAQCFPITFEISKYFFEYIERYNNKSWQDSIISSIDFSDFSGFSEYETIGTFISHKYPDLLKWNSSKWSRLGYEELFKISNRKNNFSKIFDLTTKYDYVSFENWERTNLTSVKNINLNYFKKIFSINKFLNKFKKIYHFVFYPPVETIVKKIFSHTDELCIVQIGANDGIQNDPLRQYLVDKGNYSAILIEPLPFFVDNLNKLYKDRDDISIIQAAAGKEEDIRTLYYIPSDIAYQMNGEGPNNNWALGQGSFSKEIVVYWIHSNSFRGVYYRNNIKKWIESIEELDVSIMPTNIFIPANKQNIFLIIDVQGFEYEVVSGINWKNPPRYIMIEEDLSDNRARKLLIEKKYKLISSNSHNLIFKLL